MQIIDPAMEPYFIDVDGSNFTVVKTTEKLDKKQNPVTEIVGYFTSVPSCIERIAHAQVEASNKAKAVTLKAYVQEIRSITEKLLNVVQGALSA